VRKYDYVRPICASEEGSRESVDAGCRRLTAAWARERAARDSSIELCDFFEQHQAAGQDALLPPGGCRVRSRAQGGVSWEQGRLGGGGVG
jgi:DNA excision repair protein ERCC-2